MAESTSEIPQTSATDTGVVATPSPTSSTNSSSSSTSVSSGSGWTRAAVRTPSGLRRTGGEGEGASASPESTSGGATPSASPKPLRASIHGSSALEADLAKSVIIGLGGGPATNYRLSRTLSPAAQAAVLAEIDAHLAATSTTTPTASSPTEATTPTTSSSTSISPSTSSTSISSIEGSTTSSVSSSTTPTTTTTTTTSSSSSGSRIEKKDDKFDLDRWEAIRRSAALLQTKLDGEKSTSPTESSSSSPQPSPTPSCSVSPSTSISNLLSAASTSSSSLSSLASPTTSSTPFPTLGQLQSSSTLRSSHGTSAEIRIVVGGGNQVGRTSLLTTLTGSDPPNTPASEAQVYRRSFTVGGTSHSTDITDLPPKHFNDDATFRFYCQKADAFILVYSITDSKSYEKVKQMVKRISELQVKKVPLLLFGTKADLKNESQKVQLMDVQQYAAKWSPDLLLSVAEGSSKDLSGIETAVLGIVGIVVEMRRKRAEFECMLADKTLVMKIGEGKDFKADHVYLRVWLADAMGNPKEYKGQKIQSKILDKSPTTPVWNETLEYNLKGLDFTQYEGVLLECYNKASLGKDDFLGQLIWDWRGLENLLGTKSFFQIKSRPTKGTGEPKIIGTIGIGIAVKRTRA